MFGLSLIGCILWIIVLILFSFLLYPVIKLAVKNGIIAAYDEIELRKHRQGI